MNIKLFITIVCLTILSFKNIARAETQRSVASTTTSDPQKNNGLVIPTPKTKTVMQIDLVWIPPGTFSMDYAVMENRLEAPEHMVTITRGFWMSKYETTQAQWTRVMGSNPSYEGGPQRPVERVSWYECQQFVAKINSKLQYGNFSLPTEAQWGYVSKSGNNLVTAKNINSFAWHHTNACNTPCVVGLKRVNSWGVHDMTGNVWEWCNDWYGKGYYKNSKRVDPKGPLKGSYRINRGGGCETHKKYCTSTLRSFDPPSLRSRLLGFRVVFLESDNPDSLDLKQH